MSVVATGMNDTFQEKNKEVEINQNENISKTSNDISILSKKNEIKIEDNNTPFQVKTEEIEQIDIESEISSLEIENEIKINKLKENDFLIQTRTKSEDLTLNPKINPDNNISDKQSINIFKRLSSFFVNKKSEERYLHPNINLNKNLIKNDLIEDIQVDDLDVTDFEVKEISETISKNNDLFEIEEKNKVTAHQIDLIDMDYQTEEIDEKVLEIPAFLRRQAN